MRRYLSLLVFPAVFVVSAFGYYGGGTLNHGHTNAPGDGGPLSNPSISGTATIVGLSLSTLTVSGRSTFNSTTTLTKTLGLNGTISTPTYSFANCPTCGMYLSPPNNLVLTANGGAFLSGDGGVTTLGIQGGGTTAVNPGSITTTFGGTPNPWNEGYFNNVICFSSMSVSTITFNTSNTGNAPVGSYGEIISSATTNVKPFPATSVFGDLISITLTPGQWHITGMVYGTPNGGSSSSGLYAGIGTVSGNNDPGVLLRANSVWSSAIAATGSQFTPDSYVTISVSTIYYLKYLAVYTVATPNAEGYIKAQRIR